MLNLFLNIIQDRIELLRRPKALVMGNERGIDLCLENNQLSSRQGVFERIKHIERQIAQAEIEIAVAFDAVGNILAIMYGKPSTVKFDWKQELLIKSDCIITHNHPHQSYFSSDDLSYIHRLQAAELRAVAGRVVHRLVRPVLGWDHSRLNQLWTDEVGKLKHRIGLGKVSQEQVEDSMRKLPRKLIDALSLFTQPDNL
jgi:hypothetical protein